jgi:hypothetical protein
MCLILMHKIFNPFIINLGCHFSNIALIKIESKSNVLALCAIAMILVTYVHGSQRYDTKSLLDLSKKNVSSSHTKHNVVQYP